MLVACMLSCRSVSPRRQASRDPLQSDFGARSRCADPREFSHWTLRSDAGIEAVADRRSRDGCTFLFDSPGHKSAPVHLGCGERSGDYLCICDDRDNAHLDYEQAICRLNQFRVRDTHAVMLELLYPGESEPVAPEHANDPEVLHATVVASACGPDGQRRAMQKLARSASDQAAARDVALRSKLTLSEREAIEAPLREEYERDAAELRRYVKAVTGSGCASSEAFVQAQRLQSVAFETPR